MNKIPLFKVFMADEAKRNVADVLDSGFIGQGPKVEEFERLLREKLGVPYINTINSATSGLQLAIHLIKSDFGPDDEILSTPLTCTVTNFAILANNIKIKWVDVDPDTCNMDHRDLARKISPKTKAIMLVHWGGMACDLQYVEIVTKRCQDMFGFKPHIIEDCAHAWGSKFNDKLIGTHGNFSVFSFQAIKHLTTGDGGALICPNDEYHRRAKLLRWYGLDRNSSADFRCEQNIQEWGFKYHMNDIAASIGISNLHQIDPVVDAHRSNGKFFQKELANVPGVKLLKVEPNCDPSYWVFTLDQAQKRDGSGVIWLRHLSVSVGKDVWPNQVAVSQLMEEFGFRQKLCDMTGKPLDSKVAVWLENEHDPTMPKAVNVVEAYDEEV
jgi:dTDP-4-amino-4,6-dideoxygalactose transaminase